MFPTARRGGSSLGSGPKADPDANRAFASSRRDACRPLGLGTVNVYNSFMKALFAGLGFVCLGLVSGCYSELAYTVAIARGEAPDPFAAPESAEATSEVVTTASDSGESWRAPPLVPKASSRDQVPTGRTRAFDAVRARSALGAVSFAQCGPSTMGAPGHAKVSFSPHGYVVRVEIEKPAGLPPETVACIGNVLAKVTVPPFDGAAVVAGTTFRLP